MDDRKFKMLDGFCNIMNAKIPEARIIEDYYDTISRYSDEAVDETLRSWRRENSTRFPSPNELLEKLIEVSAYLERRGGPRTVRDLFGNKVRVDTPLSRRFQQIFKELMTGKITGPEALKQVDEAEGIYGPAQEAPVPPRKTIDECIEDARIDKSMAIRAAKKPMNKRNEHECDTLRDLYRELAPNGYFVTGATDKELLIGPMDEEAWAGNATILREYASRI